MAPSSTDSGSSGNLILDFYWVITKFISIYSMYCHYLNILFDIADHVDLGTHYFVSGTLILVICETRGVMVFVVSLSFKKIFIIFIFYMFCAHLFCKI